MASIMTIAHLINIRAAAMAGALVFALGTGMGSGLIPQMPSPKFQLETEQLILLQLSVIGLTVTSILVVSLSYKYGQKQLIKELVTAKNGAEKANTAKSRFLANMSHEVRTPMNGVLGMTQLLASTELNDSQKKYTEMINSCGNALLSVINDILDISKIEAGQMKLGSEPFNLTQLLDDSIDCINGVAFQKKLDIHYSCSKDLQETYQGDPKRLKQILINLLGNAVKFTEKGSVTLTVSKTENDLIRFDVVDTGPGIDINQQTDIFKHFVQVDESHTRGHDGTGLGLSISKNLTELMGGTIGVESSPGNGANFWFTADLTPIQTPQSSNEQAKSLIAQTVQETSADQENFKILLAEDNHFNQQLVMEIVAMIDGTRLSIAENGAEVIEHLGQEKVDLLLLDINMPVMSGDEVLETIRESDASYKDLPIIIVSANAFAEHRETYLSKGADGFLSKPFKINDLIEEVDRFKDRKQSAKQDLKKAAM